MPPRRRAAFFVGAAAAAVLIGCTIYGWQVERLDLEVTRHQISARVSEPLVIAHVTDLHTTGLGPLERRILKVLAGERPDLIVVTGDSVTRPWDYSKVAEVLVELRAPLGVWLVEGNWEQSRPLADKEMFYRSAGVQWLSDSSGRARDDVAVIGFEDPFRGRSDVDEVLDEAPDAAFRLALFHSPSLFDRMAGRVDLALAGHTHGGQIRLPIVGAVILPPHSGDYVSGWYEKNGSPLYVSRGVGTSAVPVRFMCRPEIAIISIEPTGSTE